MKKIENFSIEKTTEKAYLIKLDSELFWFAISKVEINNNVLEMTEETFNSKVKVENNDSKIKVITNIEDYSVSSFKIYLKIKNADYETNKFLFFPKSKVTEFTENYLIVPKWIYDKSVKEVLEKECEFYNNKYSKSITPEDYKILTEVEAL